MIWTNSSSAVVEVDGKKGDPVIEIKTDTYEVHWKTGAQMGYAVAFVGGEPLFVARLKGVDSIIPPTMLVGKIEINGKNKVRFR